jgi:hypothetical protein
VRKRWWHWWRQFELLPCVLDGKGMRRQLHLAKRDLSPILGVCLRSIGTRTIVIRSNGGRLALERLEAEGFRPNVDESKRQAYLALLAQNFKDVDWVKRLDQQLVYVPLGVVLAAILAAINLRSAPEGIDGWVVVILVATGALVFMSLRRNDTRHRALLTLRQHYLAELGADEQISTDPAFRRGRWLYYGFVLVGLAGGGAVLLTVLWW